MKGWPYETPQPSYQTAHTTTPQAIALTSTILQTAPAIKGGDVAKKIEFTVDLASVAIETIIFTLFKDGVAQSEPLTHRLVAADVQLVSMHWVDEAPGKGEPVYSIRATGSVGANTIASTRHLTVSNL